MGRDKFLWDGRYNHRDGERSSRRSQRAHDAQLEGRYPMDEATSYVARALGISKDKAQKMLVQRHHRDYGEWHHVGPEARKTEFYNARELVAIKKLDAADPHWIRRIYDEGQYDFKWLLNDNRSKEHTSVEVGHLAKMTGLNDDKIWDVYRNMRSQVNGFDWIGKTKIANALDAYKLDWLEDIERAVYANSRGGDDNVRKAKIRLLAQKAGLEEEDVLKIYHLVLKNFITPEQKEEWESSGSMEEQDESVEAIELEEVQKMFGKDFLGFAEAENFTGVALPPLVERAARTQWQDKVRSVGITREFLERLKQEGFMVVYRQGKMRLENDVIVPVSVENLSKAHGKWLREYGYDDTEMSAGWVIVKKEVLEESRDKTWLEQEKVLQEWAREHGLDEKLVRRRRPEEVVYDVLINNANSQALLEKCMDWTSKEYDDFYTSVGVFDSVIHIDDSLFFYKSPQCGVCPCL